MVANRPIRTGEKPLIRVRAPSGIEVVSAAKRSSHPGPSFGANKAVDDDSGPKAATHTTHPASINNWEWKHQMNAG